MPQVYTIGNKYYFENTKSWNKVYAYAWTGETANASWPGVPVKVAGTKDGNNVYCAEFDYDGQFRMMNMLYYTTQRVHIIGIILTHSLL